QGHRRRHRPHPGLWQGARHSHAGRAARAPVPGAGRPVRGGGHRPGAAAQGLRRDRGALCRAPGWWRARCLLMPQETPPMTDTPTRKTPATLRSHRWFASDDIRGFAHRQRMQQQGLNREEFMGRPVIALINTWSDLSPCHAHLRERAEAVKRGVLQAGGYPLELPALSLGEVMVKPTTMLYRNLLSVECEELLRSLPIDGAVLMGGCDKTPPALVMGALSMDLPVIFMPAGPMLTDRYRGEAVGAGTHTKKFFAEYTIGAIGKAEWVALESRMTRSVGTCNTMGTASTMTAIVEALGLSLPGAMAIPAVDAAHTRMAWQCGYRAVEMVWEDLRPSRICSAAAFRNAMVAYVALGGSTNAAVHLPAMAGRAGIALSIDEI